LASLQSEGASAGNSALLATTIISRCITRLGRSKNFLIMDKTQATLLTPPEKNTPTYRIQKNFMFIHCSIPCNPSVNMIVMLIKRLG